MISCHIKNTKQFMNILLNSETFDSFLLEQCRIVTGYTLEIDGRSIPEYYEGADEKPDSLLEFVRWHDIRPMIFAQIKGKLTPVLFQFTLYADMDYARRLIARHELSIDPDTLKCLFVNIRYEHGKLSCITGTSFTTFVADKELDKLWDITFQKSLDTLHIDYEKQ